MSFVYIAAGLAVLFGNMPFLDKLGNAEIYLLSGGLFAYGTYRFYRSYKKLKDNREENSDEQAQ